VILSNTAGTILIVSRVVRFTSNFDAKAESAG